MRVKRGIRVKRLHKKRECSSTLILLCNCCEVEAVVEIEFLNLKPGKDKINTVVRLCEEHLKTLKEFISYF